MMKSFKTDVRRLSGAAVTVLAAVLMITSCNRQIPLVYGSENTGEGRGSVPKMLPVEELDSISVLPDPFLWADGKGRVKNIRQWERRRQEIMAMLEHYEVGKKPRTPKSKITAEVVGYREPDTPRPPMIGFDGKPFHSPYENYRPDTIIVSITEGGETLTMHCPVYCPEGAGPFPAIIGMGQGAGSLPPDFFISRGIAMIGFPFQEVMSHTQTRGNEPINRLYPDQVAIGAYAAWPWGVSRLIDALEILGEASKIDIRHLAVSGCSFAGKMALWSGAFDERIALTIAQEPGGGGAAAWRVTETLGWVERLKSTNYAWFLESMMQFGECVDRLPVDHHELCALVAPRALLVFGNPDYEWLADESGYVSCAAARKVWEEFGIEDRMGYSFRDGHMHCMLPEDQFPELEAFVDRFLLGREADTRCTKAPMFEGVDVGKWVPWSH